MQEPLRDPSHSSAIDNRQDVRIAQVLTELHAHCHPDTSRCRLGSIVSVFDDAQGEEQEGVSQTIIHPGQPRIECPPVGEPPMEPPPIGNCVEGEEATDAP